MRKFQSIFCVILERAEVFSIQVNPELYLFGKIFLPRQSHNNDYSVSFAWSINSEHLLISLISQWLQRENSISPGELGREDKRLQARNIGEVYKEAKG